MAQYQITLNDEILKGLFQQDGGVARLVEQVLN
jgi:putative transposase